MAVVQRLLVGKLVHYCSFDELTQSACIVEHGRAWYLVTIALQPIAGLLSVSSVAN